MAIITDEAGRELCVKYVCDNCDNEQLTTKGRPSTNPDRRDGYEPVCRNCGQPKLRRQLVNDADRVLEDLLTERQREVLDLKKDMTRAEVADELEITENTLNSHEDRIRRKRTKARERAQRS
jgi:FixJ family two-component response regulator